VYPAANILAIDGRTTRHEGYALSQKHRKRIEEPFGWGKTIGMAALFGFFAYATYDLTNLATLKQWPVGLSLMDVAWGTCVSAVAAAGGKALVDWVAPL
jgi:hypothetical protein